MPFRLNYYCHFNIFEDERNRLFYCDKTLLIREAFF